VESGGNFEDYIRLLSCHLFGPVNHGENWKGWERSDEKDLIMLKLLSEDSHIIFHRFSAVEGTLRTFAAPVISFVRDISPTSIAPLSCLPWLSCHDLNKLTRWTGNAGSYRIPTLLIPCLYAWLCKRSCNVDSGAN
jgi:hypothetical protein